MRFSSSLFAVFALLSVSVVARPTDVRISLEVRDEAPAPEPKAVVPKEDAPKKDAPKEEDKADKPKEDGEEEEEEEEEEDGATPFSCATSLFDIPHYESMNKCLGLSALHTLNDINDASLPNWQNYLSNFCSATACADDVAAFALQLLEHDCAELITEMVPGGGMARKILELVLKSGPLVRDTFCARNDVTNQFCFIDIAHGFGNLTDSLLDVTMFKGNDNGKLDTEDLKQFGQAFTTPFKTLAEFKDVDSDVLCSPCMSGFIYSAKELFGVAAGKTLEIGGMGCGEGFGSDKNFGKKLNGEGGGNALVPEGAQLQTMLCMMPTDAPTVVTVISTVTVTATPTDNGAGVTAEPTLTLTVAESAPVVESTASASESAPVVELTPSASEPAPVVDPIVTESETPCDVDVKPTATNVQSIIAAEPTATNSEIVDTATETPCETEVEPVSTGVPTDVTDSVIDDPAGPSA